MSRDVVIAHARPGSSRAAPIAPSRRAVVTGLCAATLCAAAPTPARPQRIVSLNPCLDVILVQLVDRRRIAALSHWASEANGSTIAALARTLPKTYESAEEVIALAPDLVLGAKLMPLATRQALARSGLNTALFDVPETIATSIAQVRDVARAVGESARGERIVARIEAALRAAAPPPGMAPVSALVFMAGGFASGPGTLMDELMRRAGLSNAITRYGFTQSRNVPLELLVADPPQLLLSGETSAGAPGWAQRVMQHPALAHVVGGMRRAVFPERLLYCGGPVMIPALATLVRARQSVVGA
ncbi:iron complex transport system substrate-binding protein [Sphingomonas sp. BE270]|jgi:iron complex transport system substrate-binding protein|uniref:ABC transporter substrate-binding protein n=1 Tax=unclassified Sphingomonas TaxID=196159 RepID=UPI0010F47D30|nr:MULTISPECIES: ABC transporter substrate-binding protein [unclassified Sphingomonas]MDR6847600.1 iron complex transport system substrate-binding protein [Sphingomonas sp. BE137]MDR7257632.1 iron complex transport system substrate-binding protein [Sphingomonas sp. BE270]